MSSFVAWKQKLGNSEARGAVDSVVSKQLEIYLEQNPSVAKMTVEKSVMAQRAREAAVMFNISDVMIDKEEIAMKMQLPIHVPEEITIEDSASVSVSETVTDSQITVTKNDSCVPDSHMKFIVQKVAELLDSQGIPCCHCSKTRYILSPLSACKDIFNTFTLNIICPYGNAAYRFELSVSPGDESAQKMPAVAEPSALKGGE